MSSRMLANACKRIDSVLAGQHISIRARIRGLAHLAYAKKRLGEVEQALETIEEAANLAKDGQPAMFPLLAYNVACYACLLSKPEAFTWLRMAIGANSQYKESAKSDSDFESIRAEPEFQSIVK